MTSAEAKADSQGILTDEDVIEAAGSGLLLAEGFLADQLDGCAYEFRVGRIGYTYDYPNMTTRRYEAEEHVIYPFETITIVTVEQVNLDREHFLSLLSKGSLFSLGLSAVCTAADPGFRGHLGITLTNMGTRPVVLPVGSGFVKGVFFRLSKKVSKHYVGQHGDATMSWPYPAHYHTEPPDFDSVNSRCWSYLPPPVLDSFRRLRNLNAYIRWITGTFVVLAFLNIASQVLQSRLPQTAYSGMERYLSLAGAFASIVGLLFALALRFGDKKGAG